MQMEMPTTAFICDLDAVEPAAPVAAKFAVTQPCEPFLQLVNVATVHGHYVLNGQHDVFRLADFACPPCYGCGAAFGQFRLTFGTVKAVASVAKDLHGMASAALGVNELLVAIFQYGRFFGHARLPKFGRNGQFVHRSGFPELAEHQSACRNLPSYSPCLKLKGTGLLKATFVEGGHLREGDIEFRLVRYRFRSG
jgi:hypothetical protein